MPDARTIAAVHAACPRDTGQCAYPACECSMPLVVRRAPEAADAWEVAHGWQPIATAPLDRAILVGRGNEEGWHVGVVQWDDWNGWWRSGRMSLFPDPTHWHSLPEPPEAART